MSMFPNYYPVNYPANNTPQQPVNTYYPTYNSQYPTNNVIPELERRCTVLELQVSELKRTVEQLIANMSTKK